jgi:hypothetical protein
MNLRHGGSDIPWQRCCSIGKPFGLEVPLMTFFDAVVAALK